MSSWTRSRPRPLSSASPAFLWTGTPLAWSHTSATRTASLASRPTRITGIRPTPATPQAGRSSRRSRPDWTGSPRTTIRRLPVISDDGEPRSGCLAVTQVRPRGNDHWFHVLLADTPSAVSLAREIPSPWDFETWADDLDRAVIALSRQDFTTSTTLTGRWLARFPAGRLDARGLYLHARTLTLLGDVHRDQGRLQGPQSAINSYRRADGLWRAGHPAQRAVAPAPVHRVHPRGRARRGAMMPLAERESMSTAHAATSEHHADAKLIWDYHQLGHQLRPCSAGIGLGSHDLGVATLSAGLYRAGLFPVLVFSAATAPPPPSASRAARPSTTPNTPSPSASRRTPSSSSRAPPIPGRTSTTPTPRSPGPGYPSPR